MCFDHSKSGSVFTALCQQGADFICALFSRQHYVLSGVVHYTLEVRKTNDDKEYYYAYISTLKLYGQGATKDAAVETLSVSVSESIEHSIENNGMRYFLSHLEAMGFSVDMNDIATNETQVAPLVQIKYSQQIAA